MAGEILFENCVEVGGRVFWDAPGEVVEGEVLAVADATVTARVVRRWRGDAAEPGPDIVVRFPEAFFGRSLAERRAARTQEPWWWRMAGSFAGDPEAHAEMVRLGREYNESTRPPEDDSPVEPTR